MIARNLAGFVSLGTFVYLVIDGHTGWATLPGVLAVLLLLGANRKVKP